MQFWAPFCKCLSINIINEYLPLKYPTCQYNYYFWCVFVMRFSCKTERCMIFFCD